MEVQKVSETLNRLSSMFGSASILAGLIEEFGLFNGRVDLTKLLTKRGDPDTGFWWDDCGETDWIFQPETWSRKERHAFSWASDGWCWPAFGAFIEEDKWVCSIGFGLHGAILVFSTKTGDLIEVHPDDSPSERCWGTDDYKSRVAQVLAAANTQLPERLPVEPYRAPQGSKLDGDFDVPELREE